MPEIDLLHNHELHDWQSLLYTRLTLSGERIYFDKDELMAILCFWIGLIGPMMSRPYILQRQGRRLNRVVQIL